MFDLQGAARPIECTDLAPTDRPSGCSPDQWERARVACAALLQKALASISREWLAEQIGRSSARVETWLALSPKKPAAPLTLLVAERADASGFVLDDEDLERVVAELRAYRARIAQQRGWWRR